MSNPLPPRRINPALLIGGAKKPQADAGAGADDFKPLAAGVRRQAQTAGPVDSTERVKPSAPAPAKRFVGDGVVRPATPQEGFSSRSAVKKHAADAPVRTRPAVEPAPSAAAAVAPATATSSVPKTTPSAPATAAPGQVSTTGRRINNRFADPTPQRVPAAPAPKPVPRDEIERPAQGEKLPTRRPNRVERVPTSAAVAPRFSLRDRDAEAREAHAEEQALAIRGVLRGKGGKFESASSGSENQKVVGKPNFLSRGGKAKYVQPSEIRGASNISVEEWTDDRSNDAEYGLTSERDSYRNRPRIGSDAIKISERDIIMLKFLARYRYANALQLGRLTDSSPKRIMMRLNKLEEAGFARKQVITARQYLWITTKAGNLLVDSIFPPIKKGTISYATIAHTLGLAELGVELEREAGGKNILGPRVNGDVDEVPANRWKFGIWGHEGGKTFGEMTVTEREIRQGQMRWRGDKSTLEMREVVDLAIASPDAAPELEEGNEGLFVVYGATGADGEHIPDLVVARERGEEGEVKHIAIELELTAKPLPSWKRILRWYRDNGVMYDKIVYFTPKPSIANALRKADLDVGLGEDRLIIRKYIPEHNRTPFYG